MKNLPRGFSFVDMSTYVGHCTCRNFTGIEKE